MPREVLPGPCRVLVVDDSPVARAVLDQALRASFRVPVELTATSDLSGVKPRDDRWHLMLVDIDHDTDGTCDHWARLAVACWRVATTLYDDEERLMTALGCGAHGYLLKQDPIERQIEMLQRIVQGSPDVTPAMARGLVGMVPSTHPDADLTRDALGAIGRGASLREVARELGRPVSEVEALVTDAYRRARLREPH